MYGVLEHNTVSRENPIYIRMYQDLHIHCYFTQLYELFVESTDGGTVVPREGHQYYWGGEEVTLTAEPERGFFFLKWEGDIHGAQFSGNQITLSMTLDRNITAIFVEFPQPRQNSLQVGQLSPGTIDARPGPVSIEFTLVEGGDNIVLNLVTKRSESLGICFPSPDTLKLFPWDHPEDTVPESDIGQSRQTGEGEKPAGKLPDSSLRRLEVIISPGKGGDIEVITQGLWPKLDIEGPLIEEIGEVTVKPSGGPEGSWETSLVFNWTLSSFYPIKIIAKPHEGWRFVRWNTDKFTKVEELSSTKPWFWGAFGPQYNPENPVLTIPVLRGNLTLHAHFAPIPADTTPSEDALPEEGEEDTEAEAGPITVNLSTTSETTKDEAGCRSIVTIDYEAINSSGESNPISDVQLDVNGERYRSWSGIPTEHYQEDTLLESDCSEVYIIQLTATNYDGETKTTTRQAKIPPLSTHFTYEFRDAPSGGDCQVQLRINYQAVDLGTPENPITNVVVKANGATWDNSGSISSLLYEQSFDRLVGCGHIYRIEVIGTDANGNKYTYRKTINIPEEEPPDEPPPPPPPPPTPQTTLYAAMAASAQCTASGPECSCQLSISFDGKDLTLGDYPVTQVILKVNGTEWHNSGPISKTHHHSSVTKTVDCGQTFNMVLTVKNTLGQTATSTGSITTPIP